MDGKRIEQIEGWVVKLVSVLLGMVIATTTYLIQTKISEMTESMKAIEKTTNNIQIQQMGFQKDVEYLRLEQHALTERVQRLEK